MGITKKDIEKQKLERMGETSENKEGYKMKIIKYNSIRDVTIEFQDEYKARLKGQYYQFKDGRFKNPYHKSVCGVGYLGEGKYLAYEENNKTTKVYLVWKNMISRCYDPYYINDDRRLSYVDCFVCEEWHNFQNFAKWYEENYYEIDEEKMHLDKDILIKGNKIYSPETCIFVPSRINVMFTKGKRNRGEYPIGVSYYPQTNKLKVCCSVIDKNGKRKTKHLDYFPLNKPFQAFYTYKIFKENYIKQVADEYRSLIPNELYNALYSYKVEIND